MKKFALILLMITTTAAIAGSCSSSKKAKQARHKSNSLPDIVDTALAGGQFTTLTTALGAAGLTSALKGRGPFTVFAPTDEAFAKLPADTVANLLKPENREHLIAILTYHVVKGRLDADAVSMRSGATTLNGQRLDFNVEDGAVSIDESEVIAANINTRNGVIHAIDTVLLPEDDTIVGVAQNAGTFMTLLKAAQAADLVDVLDGDGPFTVFAPTDEAFAKLPRRTLNDLLKPENRNQLASILKYHVVSGRVYAKDAIAAERAHTLQGDGVNFDLADGRFRVNNARGLALDVEADNGVIHVIDTVLLPN